MLTWALVLSGLLQVSSWRSFFLCHITNSEHSEYCWSPGSQPRRVLPFDTLKVMKVNPLASCCRKHPIQKSCLSNKDICTTTSMHAAYELHINTGLQIHSLWCLNMLIAQGLSALAYHLSKMERACELVVEWAWLFIHKQSCVSILFTKV